MKALLATVGSVAALAAVGASSALAGEVTGPWPNGTPLWTDPTTHALHGKSACAYSGLNILGEDPATGRTQSWGQIDKPTRAFLTSVGSNPGVACNPTKAAPEG